MSYPYKWTGYVHVNAPPEFVFDFLSDPMRIVKYLPKYKVIRINSEVQRGSGVKSTWSTADGKHTWEEEIPEATRPWSITVIEGRGVLLQYFLKPSADGKGTEIDLLYGEATLRKSHEWHRRRATEKLVEYKANIEAEYTP